MGWVNTLMGREKGRDDSGVDNSLTFINELNKFYCRFDTTDDSTECNEICKNLPCMTSIVINSSEVKQAWSNSSLKRPQAQTV